MSMTPRLSLPFLVPGQAQKELIHNEALQILDILVALAVEEPPISTPPVTPIAGKIYIVGDTPVGDWSGHTDQLACFTPGGWRFIAPQEGMSAYVRSMGVTAVYKSGIWDVGTLTGSKVVIAGQQVLGERLAAIPSPDSGSVIDVEARIAIAGILSAMRQHGLIET